MGDPREGRRVSSHHTVNDFKADMILSEVMQSHHGWGVFARLKLVADLQTNAKLDRNRHLKQ